MFGAWQELDSMRRSPFFSAWRDMRDIASRIRKLRGEGE